ncbi:MAG: hypothetical protein JXA60_09575 [Candidatus Coatesbacteria bacterium]|nr:hypothetical protein [Candidatus Coatesbacteria bacterium]
MDYLPIRLNEAKEFFNLLDQARKGFAIYGPSFIGKSHFLYYLAHYSQVSQNSKYYPVYFNIDVLFAARRDAKVYFDGNELLRVLLKSIIYSSKEDSYKAGNLTFLYSQPEDTFIKKEIEIIYRKINSKDFNFIDIWSEILNLLIANKKNDYLFFIDNPARLSRISFDNGITILNLINTVLTPLNEIGIIILTINPSNTDSTLENYMIRNFFYYYHLGLVEERDVEEYFNKTLPCNREQFALKAVVKELSNGIPFYLDNLIKEMACWFPLDASEEKKLENIFIQFFQKEDTNIRRFWDSKLSLINDKSTINKILSFIDTIQHSEVCRFNRSYLKELIFENDTSEIKHAEFEILIENLIRLDLVSPADAFMEVFNISQDKLFRFYIEYLNFKKNLPKIEEITNFLRVNFYQFQAQSMRFNGNVIVFMFYHIFSSFSDIPAERRSIKNGKDFFGIDKEIYLPPFEKIHYRGDINGFLEDTYEVDIIGEYIHNGTKFAWFFEYKYSKEPISKGEVERFLRDVEVISEAYGYENIEQCWIFSQSGFEDNSMKIISKRDLLYSDVNKLQAFAEYIGLPPLPTFYEED